MILSAFLCLAAIPQAYRVADLDRDASALGGVAWRVHDSGQVAGSALAIGAPDWQGVIYSAAGTQFLPNLPGDEVGSAYDVNAAGTAVGESDDVVPIGHQLRIYPHAVVWIQGQVTPLTSLISGGDPIEPLNAYAINDRGQILGYGRYAAGSFLRTFLLENGIVTDLDDLHPGPDGGSSPGAMNERGQVVGTSDGPLFFRHAFLWENGVMEDLHDPAILLGRVSSAWDINDRGQIVGGGDYGADFLDYEVATLWDNGAILNLGLLAGNESWARGINDHGLIVGGALNGSFENVAVMWQDGALVDLNTRIPAGSGWHLLIANDVDNSGRIIGEGSYLGALRPFVLIPECDGAFQVYGAGCAGGGGYTPYLTGSGCPEPGGIVSLALTLGAAGQSGLLLAGIGTGVHSIAPGCDLQILPLLDRRAPLGLDSAGSALLRLRLPAGLAPGIYNLQAALRDPGASSGATVSNPLRVDVR